MLKDQVTGTLAQKASGMLGESEDGITKALGGGFPAILGSMISKGSSDEGAGGLLESISGFDGGMLDNIGSMFGGSDSSAVDSLMGKGGGVLDMLMGDKLGGVVDLISKVGGIGKSSSGSLLKMAAPFLMSMVGKQIAGKGIGGLMDLLKGQKEHVSAAMPSGMGSMLGLGSLLGGAKDMIGGVADAGAKLAGGAVDTAGNVVKGAGKVAAGAVGTAGNVVKGAGGAVTGASAAIADKAGPKGGFLKWLIPLVLLGALAYYLSTTEACAGVPGAETINEMGDKAKGAMEDAGGMVKDGASAVGDAAVSAGSAVGSALGAAFDNVDAAAKKALDGISFAANSAGANIMAFIDGGAKDGDGTFRFNNLTFATGSAAIQGESGVEVDNLAAILKAYPGINAEIQGHTDNVGNPENNKALSQARAESVKARLVDRGIDASRLTATGYGDAQPTASNETAEGKQENRRVEVKISQG